MVDHLQNLEMGMKTLFQNDQGTISHVLKLIVERIMQVRKFSLASSQPLWAILHKDEYLPKTNKKMWKFRSKLDRKAKTTQTYDSSVVECSELVKIVMKNA